MKQHTEDILNLNVMPDIRMLPVIQKVTQEICDQVGLGEQKTLKATLALEELFDYCLKLVRREEKPSRIAVTYRKEEKSLLLIIEHRGPHGLLEKHFIPGREESFLLTTFDAVGLKLAHDSVDDLRYLMLYDGTNRFTVTINLP